MDHKLGKAAPKSANYRQTYQFRKRNCYRCGKLGHFVRDCPTKRRKNNAQFKPKNQQKYYVNQQPIAGKWTDGSMGSNFLQVNESCHENPRKISASNLQGGFSSRPSDFSEEYSSSASDFSEDYSSSRLVSLEDYSFPAFHQFEDYLSSALESSSSALDSSEVYSSSVSDLSQFSSSSASDSCEVYSSSDTDKSEGQDLNEFKECEEIQPLQCATSSIAQKALDERLQFPIGTFVNVDSLSEIIRQVSKECLDSRECHKVVQTMHNLSVLLLINSSFSDNLSESDIQALQSVICNISQCLVKSTDDSKSTDVSASMPDKQLVAANSGKTEKDCHAAEEKEESVGKGFFQTSAEVFQSQMVNIEGELNLIKSEIRCLRTELEMDGLKKTHAGAHENIDIQTLANRNDVISGSSPEVNLVIKENGFDYTSAPVSTGGSNWLPDLNLNPIEDGKLNTGANFIEKHEDIVITQYNISEERTLKSSFSTTARPGQPNADAETKQIEGAHENGDIETLANRNDVINGSSPEVNLVIKENDFDYTSAPLSHGGSNWLPDFNWNPIEDSELNNGSYPEVNLVIKENDFDYTSAPLSHGGSNWLPDLNWNPIEDSELNTGANIEKHENIVITQHNISEEPTLKSNFSTTARPGQPNAEAETKKIEGQFRVLQKSRSCSEFDIVDHSSMNVKNASDLQDRSINFFENHTEVKKLNKNPEDNSDIIYIRDYTGNTLLEDGAMTECPTKIGSPIYVHDLKNVDVMDTLEENPCLESDSSWEQILLEDGAMTESPSTSQSPIYVHELENVDVGNTLEENPCLESDSTWEQINFNEEDHI